MTTAHRPTWHNALGGDGQGGTRLTVPTSKRSARDQPGELRLKTRTPTQLPSARDKHALAEELKKKETAYKHLQKKALVTLSALPERENPFPEDADDVEAPAARDSEKESSGSEESDDEEGELLRELEKIKKERAEKQAAALLVQRLLQQQLLHGMRRSSDAVFVNVQANLLKRRRSLFSLLFAFLTVFVFVGVVIQERAAEEQRKAEQQQRMLRANPLLLNQAGDAGEETEGGVGPLKRRWDDEVVFKNQAKHLPAPKKHFINDPVRSEFHKKFLNRYVD